MSLFRDLMMRRGGEGVLVVNASMQNRTAYAQTGTYTLDGAVYSNCNTSVTLNAGTYTVAFGAVADRVTPEAEHVRIVSGGTSVVSGIYWQSGCAMYSRGTNNLVSSAATFAGKQVSSKYEVDVYSGGRVESCRISGVYDATDNSDRAMLRVGHGGIASDTDVIGGLMYVRSAGAASGTEVHSGYLYVSKGGLVSNTVLSNGAILRVMSGGTAVGTVARGGCNAQLSSGGTAVGTVVIANGAFVFSGVADETTVTSGHVRIASGGTANVMTVSSGGTLTVSSGGTALNVTSMTDAVITVKDGGTITYA